MDNWTMSDDEFLSPEPGTRRGYRICPDRYLGNYQVYGGTYFSRVAEETSIYRENDHFRVHCIEVVTCKPFVYVPHSEAAQLLAEQIPEQYWMEREARLEGEVYCFTVEERRWLRRHGYDSILMQAAWAGWDTLTTTGLALHRRNVTLLEEVSC
jgi:hypothetical protein